MWSEHTLWWPLRQPNSGFGSCPDERKPNSAHAAPPPVLESIWETLPGQPGSRRHGTQGRADPSRTEGVVCGEHPALGHHWGAELCSHIPTQPVWLWGQRSCLLCLRRAPRFPFAPGHFPSLTCGNIGSFLTGCTPIIRPDTLPFSLHPSCLIRSPGSSTPLLASR